MSKIRFLFPLTIIASLIIVLMPQPAAAAGGEHGIRCQDGVCTLTIDLDGDSDNADTDSSFLQFTLPGDLGFVPAGTSIELNDDLLLRLPVGDILLEDAALTVQLDDENKIERLRGTSQLPIPVLNLPGGQEISSVTADVGLDFGKNLDVNAPLAPDRPYLFFNVGSGFGLEAEQETKEGREQQFSLVVPEGKQATIIIDTQEPYVYLAGDFDVNYNGGLFVVDQLMDAGALPLGALPIGQHAAVHVAAGAGKDLDKAFLELGGGVAIDEGLFGRWIGLDATPLSVEGVVALSPEGILITGLTRSSIQPDKLFDGELQAQAFIPFDDVLDSVYVQVDGAAAIPLANIDVRKSARLDTGTVIAWVEPLGNTMSGWWAAVPAASLPQVQAPFLNSAWQSASAGVAGIGKASVQGKEWASGTAIDAYQSVLDRVSEPES